LDYFLLDCSDHEIFTHLCADKSFSEFGSASYRSLSKENALRFIQEQIDSFECNASGKFCLRLKEDQRFIGVSGIFRMDPPRENEFEINYRLIKEAWSNGYGSEAARTMISYGFEELGLPRVYASVSPVNWRSKRLLSALGLKPIAESQSANGEEGWLVNR
jgi:RimJ/RimL family protein N-acetyltransferase